jgi:hypothetical protein
MIKQTVVSQVDTTVFVMVDLAHSLDFARTRN